MNQRVRVTRCGTIPREWVASFEYPTALPKPPLQYMLGTVCSSLQPKIFTSTTLCLCVFVKQG